MGSSDNPEVHTFFTSDGIEHECIHDGVRTPECFELFPTNDDLAGRQLRFTEPYGMTPDGQVTYVEVEETDEGWQLADLDAS